MTNKKAKRRQFFRLGCIWVVASMLQSANAQGGPSQPAPQEGIPPQSAAEQAYREQFVREQMDQLYKRAAAPIQEPSADEAYRKALIQQGIKQMDLSLARNQAERDKWAKFNRARASAQPARAALAAQQARDWAWREQARNVENRNAAGNLFNQLRSGYSPSNTESDATRYRQSVMQQAAREQFIREMMATPRQPQLGADDPKLIRAIREAPQYSLDPLAVYHMNQPMPEAAQPTRPSASDANRSGSGELNPLALKNAYSSFGIRYTDPAEIQKREVVPIEPTLEGAPIGTETPAQEAARNARNKVIIDTARDQNAKAAESANRDYQHRKDRARKDFEWDTYRHPAAAAAAAAHILEMQKAEQSRLQAGRASSIGVSNLLHAQAKDLEQINQYNEARRDKQRADDIADYQKRKESMYKRLPTAEKEIEAADLATTADRLGLIPRGWTVERWAQHIYNDTDPQLKHGY